MTHLHTSSNDSSSPSPSDEALLAGMASGDRAATLAFVRRYQRRVFGLALTIVRDRSSAEDVAQETLVRAWRHAAVFDVRRGTVERWILTIARNLSIDALRKQRSVPVDPLIFVDLASASSDATLDERVEHGDRRAATVSALRALPEEQRRAVVLATLHGRTAQEISEIESIPLGTSKTRIRTGLIRLRERLENDERSEQ